MREPDGAHATDTIRPHPEGHLMSRQYRTPKQRAEAALGLAERRLARARKAHEAAKAVVLSTEDEVTEAAALVDHAKTHPALREDPKLPLDVDLNVAKGTK